MQAWRFLMPSALGFTLMNARQALVDKIKGAPSRPVQAADYVARHAHAGDPENVLRTIDRFALEERWLMNVGPDKGPLMRELAQRLPAQAKILELGAYCGYSSILNYVRNCGHYDCEHRTATIEYTKVPDAVEISTFR